MGSSPTGLGFDRPALPAASEPARSPARSGPADLPAGSSEQTRCCPAPPPLQHSNAVLRKKMEYKALQHIYQVRLRSVLHGSALLRVQAHRPLKIRVASRKSLHSLPRTDSSGHRENISLPRQVIFKDCLTAWACLGTTSDVPDNEVS